MKRRVTLSIDPAVSRRARQLAHARRTSVSALVEGFLRSLPLTPGRARGGFLERWAGRFRPSPTRAGDARMKALKRRYGLTAR
jgi:hypothetical protein